MRPPIRILALLLCFLAPFARSHGDEQASHPPADGRGEAGPHVLIVQENVEAEPGSGLKRLLEPHVASVEILDWKRATRERASDADLVIVAGPSRRLSKNLVFDYEAPVLGYGPFGCVYFGRLRLKNGHPYT